MNTASWILLGILILMVLGVILLLVKTKDKGCCGCNKGDNCPHCNKK